MPNVPCVCITRARQHAIRLVREDASALLQPFSVRLELQRNAAKITGMPATLTSSMIRARCDDRDLRADFDRPESGANIFDAAALNELDEHLDSIEKESRCAAFIIASAKKSIFIAGADLQTLLSQAQSGELRDFISNGQRIFNRMAALKIPTVAAIHGACAGGGYEVTLACDYRVASDEPATRIGLPETTLGLVPAWGGCTRLPRLIGLQARERRDFQRQAPFGWRGVEDWAGR